MICDKTITRKHYCNKSLTKKINNNNWFPPTIKNDIDDRCHSLNQYLKRRAGQEVEVCIEEIGKNKIVKKMESQNE